MTEGQITRVIAAVALPPPVHGQALVSAGVVAALAQSGCRLEVHDLSPGGWTRGWRYHARRGERVLRAAWRLLVSRHHGTTTFYGVAEAGWGLVYTLLLVAVARLRGVRIFVHHHTAAQVRQRRPLLALVLRVAGEDAVQIVLSARMADELRATYPLLRRDKVRVGGNAWHLAEEPQGKVGAARHAGGGLRLGMLGNLTVAKGVLVALETLRVASTHDLKVTLTLAGPVIEPATTTALGQARQDFGARLKLAGAVNDAGKKRFFRDIDVLLFPSRYRHEAQPLVVLEALRAGVPVLAYAQGYIDELLGPGRARPGQLVALEQDFATAVLPVLQRYAQGRLADQRQLARQRFMALRRESDRQWHDLLTEMTRHD